MRTKRYLAGFAVLALTGGCAQQQIKRLEPGLELRAAVQNLAAARQAGFTLKITKTSIPDLRTLEGSPLTIAYDLGGPGADDDRIMLAAPAAGIDVRYLGKTLYAKAPAAALAARFGVDVPPALGALADGGWVSVDVPALGAATSLLDLDSPSSPAFDPGSVLGPDDGATLDQGIVASSQGSPGSLLQSLSELPFQGRKALDALKTGVANLVKGAQITRDPADARHVIVTGSTTAAYAEIRRLLTSLGDNREIDAPPDQPITLDLWIDHSRLTAAEIALQQLTLHLDMTSGATISAPGNATKLDLLALMALDPDTRADDTADATDEATALGWDAIGKADEANGKPADYLKAAIADLVSDGVTVKIVRRGVALLTTGTGKACLKLPGSADGEPTITEGACA